MVEDVYRIGDSDRVRSQYVDIELADARCIILVGQLCGEKRDFRICEALARLCPRAVTISDLLVIFTQSAEVLDLLYPDVSDGEDLEQRQTLSIEEELQAAVYAFAESPDAQSEVETESTTPAVSDDLSDDDDIPGLFCGMLSIGPVRPRRRGLPSSRRVPGWASNLIKTEAHSNIVQHDLGYYTGIMGELYVRCAAMQALISVADVNGFIACRRFTIS